VFEQHAVLSCGPCEQCPEPPQHGVDGSDNIFLP
jgi:hypothetical protein